MGESIKDECLGYFVTKDTYRGTMKLLLPVLGFFMAGAFAYAWNEVIDRQNIKSDIFAVENNIHRFDSTVISRLVEQNAKLDKLLSR